MSGLIVRCGIAPTTQVIAINDSMAGYSAGCYSIDAHPRSPGDTVAWALHTAKTVIAIDNAITECGNYHGSTTVIAKNWSTLYLVLLAQHLRDCGGNMGAAEARMVGMYGYQSTQFAPEIRTHVLPKLAHFYKLFD